MKMNYLIIEHLYIERRMRPLNLYLGLKRPMNKLKMP